MNERVTESVDSAPASAPTVAENPKESARRRRLPKPLAVTLCLALLGALLLQLWRPYFHLTDDTLTGYFPIVVEACRNLWSGESPFVIKSLFGGGYPLLHDPTVFGILSPYLLLAAPLAKTQWFYLIPDIVGTLNLLTIAGAFCCSALGLRKHLKLEISDCWIVFLSLSYAFTPFNFLVGSSWIGFVNPQASYPLVALGLVHPNRRKATVLVGGALCYGLFGGHLHPFLFLVGFGGLMSLLVAWSQRSWRPVGVYLVGGLLAFVIALPLLIPAFSGFAQGTRAAGLDAEEGSALNVPAVKLAASFLLGPASSPVVPGLWLYFSYRLYNSALAFALVNIPLVWIVCTKRRFSRLEIAVLICLGLTVLSIIRPQWLAELISHVPLARSLRWPFREVAVLTFFAHLLALLTVRADSWRKLRLPTALSVIFFGMVFLNTAPSFNPFPADRELLISGRANRFWKALENDFGPRPRIIVSAPPEVLRSTLRIMVPYTLLGSYNYACLLNIVNISGYSPTQVPTPLDPGVRAMDHSGIFSPGNARKICAKDPQLVHVALIKLGPPVIEISRGEVRRRFVFDHQSGTVSEAQVSDETQTPARLGSD